MIRLELDPAVETGAQAPEKLVERMGDLMPGMSPSLLAEFANPQGAGVVNSDVASALRATTIAGSVVDELSPKYTDGFEFWDALLRMIPSTSALVRLSPVASTNRRPKRWHTVTAP
jgi:hypothetical protein